MENGADLNLRNQDDVTALKLARDRGRKEVADILVRAGAKE
jgi:ankyrin repeat protein